MDRKTLLREYKEAARPMGVYRLLDTVNGRALVGASVNLPAIGNRHRMTLRTGGHSNAALQRDWNEHGEAAFRFEVLDTLKPPETPGYDPTDDLRVLEELWLEKLEPWGERGYNGAKKRD